MQNPARGSLHQRSFAADAAAASKPRPVPGSSTSGGSDAARTAVVVGGGPAGVVSAALLAKRGWAVTVLDRREAPSAPSATTTYSDGRNPSRVYSMILNSRATHALEDAGISVPPCAIMMKGFFYSEGFLPAFPTEGQQGMHKHRYMTSGAVLPHGLYNEVAEHYPGIKFTWGHGIRSIDFEQRVVSFTNEASGTSLDLTYDLLIGADGANSAVRQEIEKKVPGVRSHTLLNQTFSAYKTFRGLPADPWANVASQAAAGSGQVSGTSTSAGSDAPEGQKELVPGFSQHKSYEFIYFFTTKERLNLVFRKDLDGTVSGTFSFNPQVTSLRTDSLRADIQRLHPYVPTPWVDAIISQCSEESGTRISALPRLVWVSQLNGPRCVLVGDSGHPMSPSLGQGCNMALESAAAMAHALDAAGGDPEVMPAVFNAARLPVAHAGQVLEFMAMMTRNPPSWSQLGPYGVLKLLYSKAILVVGEAVQLFLNKHFPKRFPQRSILLSNLGNAAVPYDQILRAIQRRAAVAWLTAAVTTVGLVAAGTKLSAVTLPLITA